MKKGYRLLLVDDDASWLNLLATWLGSAGYKVSTASDGAAALRSAKTELPDCVLIDFNLPDVSGLQVCRQLRALRATCAVPIVVLSGPTKEKVAALEAGADYFVPKAENPAELLAVLGALFRRREMERGLLTLGDLSLDPKSREVYLGEQSAATLTPKMFELLHNLVLCSPEPLSRDELARRIRGLDGAGLSRALDILLNRLRKALPAVLAARIKSVQGFGYLYLPPQTPS